MRKGVLFLNSDLGIELYKFINDIADVEIEHILVNSDINQNSTFLVNLRKVVGDRVNIEITNNLTWENPIIFSERVKYYFGVSVLYNHIIPKKIIELFENGILNLHPSLLPSGRGNDPIPWAIIKNLDQGVTLHEITQKLDLGPIVAQREIKTDINMTAGSIYEIAKTNLYDLFIENFEVWLKKKRKLSTKKTDRLESYHSSRELEHLRFALANNEPEFEKFIRIINALNYSDGRKAEIKLSDGNIWKVSLNMQKVNKEM